MLFLKNKQLMDGGLGFEIRFENKLIMLTREESAKFSKEINKRFVMQEYNDTFLIFSDDKGITIKIELDKIIITCENGSITSFSNIVKEACLLAMDIFGLKKVSRIGFRVSAINKQKSLVEAVDGYYNFSKFDKKEMNKVGKLTGFQIVSTIQMPDNMICNISINPVMRQNIVIGPSPKDNKRTDEYGVLADIDCFYEGIYASKVTVSEFMDNAISNMENKIYPMIEAVK